jgi:hypothetical protein
VTFADGTPDVNAALDAAYHAKYDRYGPSIVGTVVGPEAGAVTLKLAAFTELLVQQHRPQGATVSRRGRGLPLRILMKRKCSLPATGGRRGRFLGGPP